MRILVTGATGNTRTRLALAIARDDVAAVAVAVPTSDGRLGQAYTRSPGPRGSRSAQPTGLTAGGW